MRIMRTGALVAGMLAELSVSGIAWAAGSAVKGIDIIVRKKPGNANMVCMADGKPCDERQVRLVAAEAAKRGVMVSLAGPDGALRCTTRDGKACTEDAVGAVQTAGRAVGTKGINGN